MDGIQNNDLHGLLPVNIDGRPLHAYRISERSFDDIELRLRDLLASKRNVSAAGPFVLWASEKYRREFDGGGFSWSFLTDSLGVNFDQSELRDMTRIGLKHFDRPPPQRTDTGSTQYLRTIAAEGGIPVRLLSSQGGYRSALVGLVADLGRFGLSCPDDQAMAFVSRRIGRLPLGYRTQEFRELFLRFAREVLELRSLAPSDLAPDQVEGWLDREQPGWRDDLSLRLDENAARSLLSEAVAVTRKTGLQSEPLRRVLTRSQNGLWKAWIEVEDEAQIPSELLHGIDKERTRLRLGPTGDLASAVPDLMMNLERDAIDARWSCRRISARRTAAFPYPLDRPASFMAVADGRYLSRVDLPGSAAIDPEIGFSLWLLSEMGEDEARKLDYAGTASLTTQDPHAWLLLAAGVEPQCTEGLIAEPDGASKLGDLWRLSGSGRVYVNDWNVSVETEAERTDRDEIVALGSIEPMILDSKGTPVFCGLPGILHRRAGRHFIKLRQREMRFRLGKSLLWQNKPPEEKFLGPLSVSVRDESGVGPRLSINVVPEGISIRDTSTENSDGRSIEVTGFPSNWTVQVSGTAIARTNNRGVASLDLPAETRLKERLPMVLAGPEGAAPLSWTLVLPRQSAEFVNAEASLLTSDQNLTLHDLRDWRIVPAQNIPTLLRIRLVGNGTDGAPAIAIPVAGELPLSSFRGLLEDILALGGPDAELRLRALSGANQSKRLVLRRYAGETALIGDAVRFSLEKNSLFAPDIETSAVDMNNPEKVEIVAPDNLDQLGAGQWFILPTMHGHPLRPPRPFIKQAIEPLQNLATSPVAKTREDRIAAYAQSFEGELSNDDLRRLSKLITVFLEHGASPASLDQTLALSRVPDVAVRLLLRASPQELADLLSIEVHGGPRWIFVSPSSWGKALKDEAQNLDRQFANMPALADMSDTLTRQQLSNRTREILTLRPELAGHIAIGLMSVNMANPIALPEWLGSMPSGFANPSAALADHANQTAQRHAAQAKPLHELRAQALPNGIEQFHTNVRGLIEAPLFAAEIAYDLRAQPTARQMIELLQAIHTDPGAFERSLPTAMAWQFSQQIS